MTDEHSYYGAPEFEFADPSELTDLWQQHEAPDINLSDGHFCVLKRHDMLRVRRELGLRHLAVLAVIKQHGDCYASPWTIARLSGCRNLETVKGYIDDLIRIAAVERVTVRGRECLRAVESDGPPKPFVMVHRAWMEHYVAPRDLWAVCSKTLWQRSRRRRRPPAAASIDPGLTPTAAAVLWLIQSRGRTYNAKAEELAAECGLSRAQFLQIANLLRDYGLISFRRAGNSMLWTTDEGCRKNPAEPAEVVGKILQAAPRMSEKSCEEVDVKQKQVDAVQRQEEKTGKQDTRRAEKRADARPSAPVFSSSEDQNPPATVDVPTTAERPDTGWVHAAGLCGGGGMLKNLRVCPHCGPEVPIRDHGCNGTGWRVRDNGYGESRVGRCPFCAAHEHGCCEGSILSISDDDGKLVTRPCEKCASERAQKRHELEAENAKKREEDAERKRAEQEAMQRSRPAFDLLSFDLFGSRSRTLPALAPAPTIEGEWREAVPRAAKAKVARDVMSTGEFDRCWWAIEQETGVLRSGWDVRTRKRLNGMLQCLGAARAGAQRFYDSLRDLVALRIDLDKDYDCVMATEKGVLELVALACEECEEPPRPATPRRDEVVAFTDEVSTITTEIVDLWPKRNDPGAGRDAEPIKIDAIALAGRIDCILRTFRDVDGKLLVDAAKAYMEMPHRKMTPQRFYAADWIPEQPAAWKAYVSAVKFRERLGREEATCPTSATTMEPCENAA